MNSLFPVILIEVDVGLTLRTQVLLRSGPTVTNKDGRLMAYCNKDLNAMLHEYLGDPSVHIYTNEEYARFSKV
jgi:hypothetical protein